jgi:bifunctional UDP-N-acetylglucosamine pyrophosphorylase/glucosamine-1-phosphate N-acetyltransferase
MSNTSLAIIILAAGKGTRMKSDQPKVMHKLAGKPMINWIIDTAAALNPEKIIPIIGPDMPTLERAIAPHSPIIQHERNGTGGAVQCALPALEGFNGDVLILLGDCPLIRLETMQSLITAKNQDLLGGLSVLGMTMNNPTGYGRLIEDKKGIITDIIEEKDATEKQRAITTVNAGAFCVDAAQLPQWLEQLNSNNAQNEFYLTDLAKIATADGATCNLALCAMTI